MGGGVRIHPVYVLRRAQAGAYDVRRRSRTLPLRKTRAMKAGRRVAVKGRNPVVDLTWRYRGCRLVWELSPITGGTNLSRWRECGYRETGRWPKAAKARRPKPTRLGLPFYPRALRNNTGRPRFPFPMGCGSWGILENQIQTSAGVPIAKQASWGPIQAYGAGRVQSAVLPIIGRIGSFWQRCRRERL